MDAELEAESSWGISPMVTATLFLLLNVIIGFFQWKKQTIFWGWDILLYAAQGIAGCIIAFLFFVSSHPTVGSNWLLVFDSVENNILLGEKKEADDYLKAVCMEREVAEMEDGKQTAVGNGGVRLSGGQAKRLALARTLCHKKPVLILDDPFSALDKNTEKQIFANLKQQTKDNIVFLISHRLYLFPQMNQVIWMEDGKAVAGTHEEILEKIPEYRSLYETQSDERENAKVETENRKTVSEHTEERRSGR